MVRRVCGWDGSAYLECPDLCRGEECLRLQTSTLNLKSAASPAHSGNEEAAGCAAKMRRGVGVCRSWSCLSWRYSKARQSWHMHSWRCTNRARHVAFETSCTAERAAETLWSLESRPMVNDCDRARHHTTKQPEGKLTVSLFCIHIRVKFKWMNPAIPSGINCTLPRALRWRVGSLLSR